MKKYIYLILSAILFVPFIANAETLTYEVCENGCEYANLNDVETAIRNIGDLSDKDIVINVNSDIFNSLYFGSIDNMANSVTINGNNNNFEKREFNFCSKKIELNDCNNLGSMVAFNAEKINIKNSNIYMTGYLSMDSNQNIKPEEINLTDVFEIDDTSLNNLIGLILVGNFKIENTNFKNVLLEPIGGTINIYDSQIDKLLNMPQFANITTNIYNSTFSEIKYKNITTGEEFDSEINNINLSDGDFSKLNYDVYDINFEEWNGQRSSNTTVYFDKETKLKPSDKLNLVDYLDYYTEDKEIKYTIEDESIAKIENKELIALKEGSTKVTVTTDEGHVVYRINLVVEKETIPEKIDKMTIKVPITGSKVKVWIVVISVILLGVIGVCSYMLIRRKK